MAGGHSVSTTMAQHGTKVRQEQQMPNGQSAVSIIDSESGDLVMLMPGQQQYVTMNTKQMQDQMGAKPADTAKLKVTATGKKDTVAGIACETYRIESPNGPPVEMCAAKGMGTIGMLGNGPGMGPASANPANNPELLKLAKEGFLPLRTVIMDAKGAPSMTMEAT